MNILIFGPPGAGKGTQSVKLVKQHGMSHISTGDLFRNSIANKTSLGLEAKKYMDKGELVPDPVVIGIVEESFEKLKGQGFILDGFPRTVPQAESLEAMLKNHGLTIDQAVFLDVNHSLLLKRLTGRRVCKSCGSVFHVYYQPPQNEGTCDKCGGSLYQREDDKEEVITVRLKAYEKSTNPLREYYQLNKKLVVVNGDGSTEEVFEQIEKILQT